MQLPMTIDLLGLAGMLLLLLAIAAGPLVALGWGVIRRLKPESAWPSVGWALGVLALASLLAGRAIGGAPPSRTVTRWWLHGSELVVLGLGGAALSLGTAAVIGAVGHQGARARSWSTGLALGSAICAGAALEMWVHGALYGGPRLLPDLPAPWWLLAAGRGALVVIFPILALGGTRIAPRGWLIAGPWLLLVAALLAPFEIVAAQHVLGREWIVAGTALPVVPASALSNDNVHPFLHPCPTVWEGGWTQPSRTCGGALGTVVVAPDDLRAAQLLDRAIADPFWVVVRSDRPWLLPGSELYVVPFDADPAPSWPVARVGSPLPPDDAPDPVVLSVGEASVQDLVDACLIVNRGTVFARCSIIR